MPSFKAFAEFQQMAKETNAQPRQLAAKQAAAGAAAPPRPATAAVAAPVAAAAAPAASAAGGASTAATPATSSTAAPGSSQEQGQGALRVGMSVRVVGLMGRPELNGLEGVLSAFEEARSRWKVDLVNGVSKLFKDTNLERYVPEKNALEEMKERVQSAQEAARNNQRLANPPASGPNRVVDSRDESESAPLNTSAAVEAAQHNGAAKATAPLFPREQDDDDAFLRSIEQCLKECDVMWDDY
mmetsp:Transcript_107379/g.346777  ORF Transcript_107379/g.346777 Transcript_107379/m.346777 type:complete len:242 (-) Transcript_107379:98-823(-)